MTALADAADVDTAAEVTVHLNDLPPRAFGVLLFVVACGESVSTAPPTDVFLALYAPPSVAVGGTLRAIAVTTPNSSIPIAWTSETPSVATVSAAGDVRGVAPGTATIRVTASQKSATAAVTVFAASFIDLAVAPKHVCARTLSGALYCWGSQVSGMLGPIARAQVCAFDGLQCSTTPVPSVNIPNFVQISAGLANTCGRTAPGEAYCWGGNPGQILSSSAETCSDGELCIRTPVKVPGATSFASIGAGSSHFCGLTGAGIAYCWGYDEFGQLGAVTTETCGVSLTLCSRTPLAVSGGLTFVAISVGEYHSCGLTVAGQAYCWGWNAYGQLGIGRTSTFLSGEGDPVAVATLLCFTAISAGRDHTCALTSVGQAYCWGRNITGQLGDGSTSDALVPGAVAGSFRFDSITTGLEHTCALTPTGVAYCWGHNRNQASTTIGGQLGDGTFETRLTPTPVARPITFVELRAGRAFTCGRSAMGTIYCWGSNAHGQIGVGDLTTLSVPTPTGVAGLP